MEQTWDSIKVIFSFIWDNLIYINMLFAILVVFFQRKEPKSAWAWLLILYFVPIIGFVFYMLAGTDMHKRRIFKNKELEDRISEIVRRQEYHAYSGSLERLDPRLKGYSDLVLYNLETQGAMLSNNNDIEILSDGVEKFDALKEDLKNAKGKTVISSDGSTLLGADDKAGVAEIMDMIQYFVCHPEVKHGTIKIAFTPDEEVGRGTKYFNYDLFKVDFAYTLDGDKPNCI